MRKTWFLSSRKKRRKRKLIAIMRYIVALKNSDHVAHFISNKVFAHLIVNIWSSIQQSNTRPETFLIIRNFDYKTKDLMFEIRNVRMLFATSHCTHPSLVCPMLFFCKHLSLAVNKKGQRTMKMTIKIFLAFRAF